MTRNTAISLGDHFGAIMGQQINHGRYGPASEVVRAGLRQLEDNEPRLTALSAALAVGENSGASTPFNVDAFVKTKRKNATVKAATS